VRRFIHQLLELFARRGWMGAPRFLGIDSRGREILSFLVGHVAWAPVQPSAVRSDASLVRVSFTKLHNGWGGGARTRRHAAQLPEARGMNSL
jgi:hypothetical protein